MDGTFSNAALQGKIQIKEQLPKYFGGSVQLGEKPVCVCEKCNHVHTGQCYFATNADTLKMFHAYVTLCVCVLLTTVTTRCVVAELNSLKLVGASHVARRFQQRKCGHTERSASAAECILALIGQSNYTAICQCSAQKSSTASGTNL